jgi:hypothetical protein
MDATLEVKAQALEDAVVRLRRIGLILDPAVLSQEHRRIAYTYVRLGAAQLDAGEASHTGVPAATPPGIGFAYPNAR